MTVSTTNNNVVYRGNGAATSFAVPFKVLDVDHLVVQRRVYATGALDHTYVGTEFTYSGLGASSGTLTLDGAALSSTYELVIDRIVPYTQELDIVNAGGFYPDTVEEQLDLIVMAIQQLADLVGRTPKAAVDDPGLVIPSASSLIGSNQVLGTDDLTGELTLLPGSAFKGDPGGNVQAIGLLTAANGITIPTGTTRICTSGYDTEGIGAAWYTYQSSFDLVTHPRAGFIAADGRKFAIDRFNQPVTTFQFGVGGLVANDDEALDAFFRYCEAFIVYNAVLSGSCQLTETARYGNGGDPATTTFFAYRFLMEPASGATMDKLWHIQCKSLRIAGKINIRGKSSGDDYADRQAVGVGIWLEDCREAVFDHIIAQRFLYHAVCSDPTNDPGNNNNGIEIKSLIVDGVGSGDSESADQSLFGTWEHAAIPHTGSGSDYSQRTHLIVPLDECPPLDIASSVNSTIDKLPLLIRLYGSGVNGDTNSSRGRLHQVTSMTDNGDGTVAVNIFPWMDPARGSSGDLTWIFGAGVKAFGDDANYWKIGSYQYQRAGVALGIACQQGPVISRFVGQNQCGVGFIVGRTAISEDESSGNGTWINGAYFEDFFDQGINLSRFDDNRNSGRVASEFTLDLSKIHAISSPRAGTTGAIGDIVDETWQNWVFEDNQTRLKYRSSPAVSPNNQGIDEYETITYTGTNVTIRLDNNTLIERLFNRTRVLYIIKGTSPTTNYAPTSVTFEGPSGSTINGTVDGTYTLSGFSGPAIFQADTTSNNVWRIGVAAGWRPSGSATWNPGSLATGATTSITGIVVAGALKGENCSGSFSEIDGAGYRITGTIYADGLGEVMLTNFTGVTKDLPEGTARIVVHR